MTKKYFIFFQLKSFIILLFTLYIFCILEILSALPLKKDKTLNMKKQNFTNFLLPACFYILYIKRQML